MLHQKVVDLPDQLGLLGDILVAFLLPFRLCPSQIEEHLLRLQLIIGCAQLLRNLVERRKNLLHPSAGRQRHRDLGRAEFARKKSRVHPSLPQNLRLAAPQPLQIDGEVDALIISQRQQDLRIRAALPGVQAQIPRPQINRDAFAHLPADSALAAVVDLQHRVGGAVAKMHLLRQILVVGKLDSRIEQVALNPPPARGTGRQLVDHVAALGGLVVVPQKGKGSLRHLPQRLSDRRRTFFLHIFLPFPRCFYASGQAISTIFSIMWCSSCACSVSAAR